MEQNNTHSVVVGYILWIFGFMGAHRFYYGKQVSGVLFFLAAGFLALCAAGMVGVPLLAIPWLLVFIPLMLFWVLDLFLIPGMDRAADRKYTAGKVNYTVAWVLLTFLGYFGIHRFYMGKWLSGLVYLLTVGLFMVGYLYDYLTLNGQVDEVNRLG